MKLKSFLKIAIFGFLLSCSDQNIIFNDYIDIENTQLSFKDTIVFQTKISDTISPHNIFLQLRISTDYKWSNMFVFSEINSIMNDAYYHMERNANPKILMLDVSIKLYKLLRTK